MNNENGFDAYIENFYHYYFDGAKYDDLVKYAIELAYSDTKRVLHGIGSESLHEIKESILFGKDSIMSLIKVEFLDGIIACEKFNEFHERLCGIWTTGFKENKEIGKCGIAQKIVNMTFKYLYAFYYYNKDDKIRLFDSCHITLDSYILKWLNKCGVNDKSKPDKLNATLKWSKILIWDDYSIIQEYSKECVKRYFGMKTAPIKAEFVIWEGIKLYEILSAWVKTKNDYPDKDGLIRIQEQMNENNSLTDFIGQLSKHLKSE